MLTSEAFNLGNLILVRLLAAKGGEDSQAVIRRSVEVFYLHRLSKSAWNADFDSEVARLCQAQAIQQTRPGRLGLTEEGRQHVLNFLALKELPPRLSWSMLRNVYLIAKALRLPLPSGAMRQRIASAGGLRAAILRRHYALPIDAYPTLAQARDALLWRQLGSSQCLERLGSHLREQAKKPFTLKALSLLLLNDLLGASQPSDPRDALNQLIAKTVAARRVDVNELRLAILRAALESPEQPQPVVREPFDLELFADRVVQAARACKTGWFGAHEVFIAHVWRQFQRQGEDPNMDENTFKIRLKEANNRHLLTLSRADLIEAMDTQDVAASEIRHFNAVYHFIRFES